jgi:hypothetical protein
MARQVFYSFEYKPDNWRASQVRSIGIIEGNRPAPDNDWETITKGGDSEIQRWIDNQMHYRSCTIVLVGSSTANRKWINYEIKKSWENKKGVVGINIHNLLDSNGKQSTQGLNPFNSVSLNGVNLSNVVKLYNPPYTDSKAVYNYIAGNIGAWADEAVKIRNQYPD